VIAAGVEKRNASRFTKDQRREGIEVSL